MFLKRSLLNVPGHDIRKIKKAIGSPADTIVLDWEDGVPPQKKAEARSVVKEFLHTVTLSPSQRQEISLRVNSLDSQFANEDHRVLPDLLQKVHSIILPKINTSEQLDAMASLLQSFPQCRPYICIESPLGLINLGGMLGKWHGRIRGLIFGCEDYCAAGGITRTPGRTELLFARSMIVNYAKAYDLDAIDMVCLNFRDSQLLQEEALDGRNLGFTGKQVIHPDQIEIVNSIYSPSKVEVERARRIMQGYEEHCIRDGRGAFDLDGIVIDLPVVAQAKKLLARHDQISSTDSGSGKSKDASN